MEYFEIMWHSRVLGWNTWLLLETHKKGQSVPVKVIIKNAEQLCPSFCKRSYHSKYQCIKRLQEKHQSTTIDNQHDSEGTEEN